MGEREYSYLINCVGCGRRNVDALNEMIDQGREITEDTFFRNVSRKEVYDLFGGVYCREFPIKNEYSVSFYKSKYKGKRCYYVNWSSIEWIFTKR